MNNKLSVKVLGLGNILLKDEGVGVHAVRRLKEECSFYPDIDIIEGGTLGLDLLQYFERDSKILVIDAVNFGKKYGHIEVFSAFDMLSSFYNKKLSVHHIGLIDIISACELLDIEPAEVRIVGIQPKSIDIGLELTEEINSRLTDLIKIAINNLRMWNIDVSRCSG